MKLKLLGQPHHDELLKTDNGEYHHGKTEDCPTLKDKLPFQKYHKETGTVNFCRIMTSKKNAATKCYGAYKENLVIICKSTGQYLPAVRNTNTKIMKKWSESNFIQKSFFNAITKRQHKKLTHLQNLCEKFMGPKIDKQIGLVPELRLGRDCWSKVGVILQPVC